VIAIRGADPIVSDSQPRAFSETPAVQGRNHAATAAASK
jgi:hypothetical protein